MERKATVIDPVIDIESEKKKNVRIAIGIAATGVTGGIFLYLMIFALFFLFPFAVFKFFPFPDVETDVAGLNGNLLLMSRKVDFSGASFGKEPEEKTLLRVFDGKRLSEPMEIRPYHSHASHGGKVFFFGDGLYRSFDGSRWEEVKTTSIGTKPKGAVSDEGIWVLSRFSDGPALKLIRKMETENIPFPEGFDPGMVGACSTRVVWFKKGLNIFFKDGNGGTYHLRLKDGRWDNPGTLEGPGDYEISVQGDRLAAYGRQGLGPVRMRAFDGVEWSEPVEVLAAEEGMLLDFHPAMFRGRPALVTQGFFSRDLLFVGTEETVRLSSGLSLGKSLMLNAAMFGIAPLVLTGLFVLAASALINRYKLRRWEHGGRRYEFASFFRRFLAHGIDAFICMLPLGLMAYLFFDRGSFLSDPFRLLGVFFLSFVGWVAAAVLYFSLLEGVWGRTLGKKLCGIRVLKEDFTRCTLAAGFVRNILRVVDSWFYYLVAAVSVGATLKWQRLGDLAAGTVVIRSRKAQSPSAPQSLGSRASRNPSPTRL